MFPEEVWILKKQPLFVITYPYPHPIALHAYLTVRLSSGYPTSSGMAHSPILLLGSFIPTNPYSNTLPYLKTPSLEKPYHDLGLTILIGFIPVFLESTKQTCYVHHVENNDK